jgi:phage baseplate assembly protein W
MEDENLDFLGKGWSFPPKFNNLFASVEMSTGNKDIHESLEILLGTIPGERNLHPEYGCDLSSLSFENISPSIESKVTRKIESAIIQFEPRIDIDSIDFELSIDNGIVFIHIMYIIRTTNTRTNMVFPYYIQEATDL